jgi:hypothetical protein
MELKRMTILLSLLAVMAQGNADAALGQWQTETKHGVVEVTTCQNGATPSICGRLVESDALRTNPQTRDAKNKDAAKRDRLLKGLMILQGFRPRTAPGWAAPSTTPMMAAPIRPPLPPRGAMC